MDYAETLKKNNIFGALEPKRANAINEYDRNKEELEAPKYATP